MFHAIHHNPFHCRLTSERHDLKTAIAYAESAERK